MSDNFNVPPEEDQRLNDRVTDAKFTLLRRLFHDGQQRENLLLYVIHWLEYGRGWDNCVLEIRIPIAQAVERQAMAKFCGQVLSALFFGEVIKRCPNFVYAPTETGVAFGDRLPSSTYLVISADPEALREMQKQRPSTGEGDQTVM